MLAAHRRAFMRTLAPTKLHFMQVRGQFIGHYLSGIAFAALHTGRLMLARSNCLSWKCGGPLAVPAGGRCAQTSGRCSAAIPGASHACVIADYKLQPTPVCSSPCRPPGIFVAGRQDLHDRCDLMVRELGRVQDAYGNGYLGALPLGSLACFIASAALGLGMAARAAGACPVGMALPC